MPKRRTEEEKLREVYRKRRIPVLQTWLQEHQTAFALATDLTAGYHAMRIELLEEELQRRAPIVAFNDRTVRVSRGYTRP